MKETKFKLKELCQNQINYPLNEEQLEKLLHFMNEVVEKNKVLNLTRIVDPSDFILKHLIDSLQLLNTNYFKKMLLEKKHFSIIDVGTGAGFPGIPLAIALSSIECELILSDSLNKRIKFLEEVKDKLDIPNIKLIHSRAEDLAQNVNYREKFDIAVSRGVAQTTVLTEYLFPFVFKHGFISMYKMSKCEAELFAAKNAIHILGGDDKYEKYKYKLYPTEPERSILNIYKVKTSPNKYPRKAGIPAKTPLS